MTDTIDSGADISEFDIDDDVCAVMEVRSPKTGEVMRHADGRPFTITFYSADSERVLRVARAQTDRRIAQQMRTRAPFTSAGAEKDNIETLVAATKEWDIVIGGQAPKSEQAEYRKVYSDKARRWLFDQSFEFIGLRANFLKA